MSFGNSNYRHDVSELGERVDMFTKLSASLVNMLEAGVATDESSKLCTDIIDTMQELLDDVRGIDRAAKEAVAKATPKYKPSKMAKPAPRSTKK
jgi:hypothetical protein